MTYSLTRRGAEELAAKIREYWMRQGLHPQVRLEPFEGGWVIRSDMLNGKPRERTFQ